MTGIQAVPTLIVVGLVCIILALFVGLHGVSRNFTNGTGIWDVRVPERVTSCGSVLAPRTPPRSFSMVTTGPLNAQAPHVQSCADARHPSLVATVALLMAGFASLLAAAGVALKRRRNRPENPRLAGGEAAPA
jgi:hypothetical protein